MIMGWKVIWGVLYQVLALIWSSETLLRRFSIFEKKVAKIRILAKNGLWSLQRARVTSDRKIWSYGVWNLLDPFFQMLFHIEVDIIRGLDQKFENRKKSFWIFPFLTIFLTVAFKGLYRRHKMTTIWAFLSDMRPVCNDTLRYRPWSSEELFRSILYVSNIFYGIFGLQRSNGQIDFS